MGHHIKTLYSVISSGNGDKIDEYATCRQKFRTLVVLLYVFSILPSDVSLVAEQEIVSFALSCIMSFHVRVVSSCRRSEKEDVLSAGKVKAEQGVMATYKK